MMATDKELRQKLQPLDGKDYTAYQSLKGQHAYPGFDLLIDRIQKDPYAPPHTGIYRAIVESGKAGFKPDMIETKVRETALRDYLARRFFDSCSKICKGRRGTGYSGVVTIAEPGQSILDRSSIAITDSHVEARFFIGFPANGRKISAKVAETILFEELPEIVGDSLYLEKLDQDEVYRHIRSAEDADHLRNSLDSLELVAFIADGAMLPRESGASEKPLVKDAVIPFESPKNLRVELTLPNAGKVTGMGIRKGVNLIVGGGYHGKSTLMRAVELGAYNHIPGDGRELCVSLPGTVKVQASSGRSVAYTDISPFINNLPFMKDTTAFTTENASGSTSQAASISEAIEAGAEALLMDEDTCAANFMIRDKRMQELVAREDEPITAFIDNIRRLHEEREVSTILVMGGSGDYFDMADCVIQMKEFVPLDVTGEAKRVSGDFPTGREDEPGASFEKESTRKPLAASLSPYNEYNKLRIASQDLKTLIFGKEKVGLSDVEQVVEKAQLKAIGLAINYAKKYMDGNKTLKEIIGLVMDEVSRGGLDLLDPNLIGDLAGFRGHEFAAVLNRIRSLEVV
jgi:predicted ABC-class ATPase